MLRISVPEINYSGGIKGLFRGKGSIKGGTGCNGSLTAVRVILNDGTVDVRFGSQAALQSNFSLMSAFGG